MKKDESLSCGIVKRIVCITIVLIILLGVGVLAGTSSLNSVTIVFADNTELTVITSKSKVSEILEENNIILLDEESVNPGLDENIDGNREIIISRGNNDETENKQIASEEILSSYSSIVEKIIKEQEEIPFETITKEASSSEDGETVNKVVQEGQNGIKEITYKVKYQDDVEIERTKLSETVIQEPVNKIVQLSKKTTSRSGSRTDSTASTVAAPTSGTVFKITAYCACRQCCGSYANGITATGTRATAGRTIAVDKSVIPLGSSVNINGHIYTAEDTGGAIKGNRIDIYFSNHAEALSWGVRYLPVQIVQ